MAVRRPRYLRLFMIATAFLVICFYTLSNNNLSHDPFSQSPIPSPPPVTTPDSDRVIKEISSNSAESPLASPDSQSEGETPIETLEVEQNPKTNDPRPSINLGKGPPHGFPANVFGSKDRSKCLTFEQLQGLKKGPHSAGKRKFPYARPPPECRTFNSTLLERLLVRMNSTIKDPDLFRLFENSYPNTLDTTIKWRGYAQQVDPITQEKKTTTEELAFVITGDINAMWLRDSASQIYSYLPLLEASPDPDSLASLWRGVINQHARYIIISPYCHSFQPPPESGIAGEINGAYHNNNPKPSYNPSLVFDCKWELDSLASFLQISVAYYQRTGDVKFFEKYHWIAAVQAAVKAAGDMRLGTYAPNGEVEESAWTFTGYTNRGSETLTNDGLGNPTKANGMVRSAFRPSDDASIYQLLVPANMMFATYLESASLIMAQLKDARAPELSKTMRDFAFGIRKGIDTDAIVHHKVHGDIFAYEIDGFGSTNLMDDANIPSLLSMPLWNFTSPGKEFKVPERTKEYGKIYENTRSFVLSDDNPYWAKGPVISAVGGPHLGPGRAWPMAAIVRALTAYSPLLKERSSKERNEEVKQQLKMVLDSTSGTGVIHESVNSWLELQWSRAWFGWANGLLGELVLKIDDETSQAKGSEGLLGQSWQ